MRDVVVNQLRPQRSPHPEGAPGVQVRDPWTSVEDDDLAHLVSAIWPPAVIMLLAWLRWGAVAVVVLTLLGVGAQGTEESSLQWSHLVLPFEGTCGHFGDGGRLLWAGLTRSYDVVVHGLPSA